jgi:hypothetical protein
MTDLIPHIKFIEALVMSRKTFPEIVEELDRQGLTTPIKVIDVIYKTLHKENPEYFLQSIGALPDSSYIEDNLQISEMFSHFTGLQLPSAKYPVKGAFKLLNDPTMYLLVTSLALAQIDDQDIELIIAESFNIDYEFEDIKIFLKYFFNLEGWTLPDRQQFVETVTDAKKLKFYRFALKGDKEYLMWKLGVTPKLNFEEKLQDMFTDSYYNFKEKSRAKPDEAQKWAGLALKFSEKLDALQKEKKAGSKSMFDDIEIVIKSRAQDSSDEIIPNIRDLNKDE